METILYSIENYNANVQENRLKMEKLREGNCVIPKSTPPNVTIAKKKFVYIKF